MVTKVSFFENAYRFRVKGLKRRFSNTMMNTYDPNLIHMVGYGSNTYDPNLP